MGKSIRAIFIGSIIILLVVFLGMLTFVNVYQISTNMQTDVEKLLKVQSSEIAEKFDKQLSEIGGETRVIAMTMNAMQEYNLPYAYQVVKDIVKRDKNIFGSGIWFAPNKGPDPSQKLFGPYFGQGDTEPSWIYSTEEYNYPSFPWYQGSIDGKNGDKVFWDEPTRDEVSNVLMVSNSLPMTHNGEIVGIVSIDISLAALDEYIRSIKVGETGYAFLVSQSGLFVSYKDEEKNMKEKIQESKEPEMAKLGAEILHSSEPLLLHSNAFGEDCYVMVTPIGDSNLKLVLVAPEADYSGAINQAIITSVGISLLAILLLCAAIWILFQRRIEEPILALMNEAQYIADGDLRRDIRIKYDDEIGKLAHSIRKMSQNIRDVIIRVAQGADQLAASSEELTATSRQSAEAATHVAENITDVAGGMERQLDSVDGAKRNIKTAFSDIQNMTNKTTIVTESAEHMADAAEQGEKLMQNAMNDYHNPPAMLGRME